MKNSFKVGLFSGSGKRKPNQEKPEEGGMKEELDIEVLDEGMNPEDPEHIEKCTGPGCHEIG